MMSEQVDISQPTMHQGAGQQGEAPKERGMTDLEQVPGQPIPVGSQARHIAEQLNEPVIWLVQRVVEVLGESRTEEIFQKTIEVEGQGGLPTANAERRRTPGGVFFKLVKEHATREERKAIFAAPPGTKPKPQVQKPAAPVAPPPIERLSWDEAKLEVARILKAPLGRAHVKLTLIGRPSQVSRTKSCVVIAMKGNPPHSIPRGLPRPPEGSDFAFAVFIATKQWERLATALAENKEDKLVVEGYPIFDPKRGVTVVLAQLVRVLSSAQRSPRSPKRGIS